MWCANALQSSIAVPKMKDTEKVFDEGITFPMGDAEGARFLEEKRNINSGRGNENEVPFSLRSQI